MSDIEQKLGFDAGGAIAELTKLDGAMAQLEARLKSTASALGSFNKSSGNATAAVAKFGTGTDAAMKTVASSTAPAISAVGRLTTSMQLLSRIVFTQAVIKGFRLIEQGAARAARSFVEFERGLSEIQAIDPTANLDDLGNTAKRLSNQFSAPLGSVVESLKDLRGSGFSAADANKVFTASAKLAKLGAAGQEEATALLITSLNSFGDSAQEANRHAAVLFAGIDKGRISAQEMASNFAKAAPAFRAVGGSVEELTSLIAALTVAGVKPSEAAVQANSLAIAFVKPSEDMAKALAALKVESGAALIQQRGLAGAIKAVLSVTDGSAEAAGRLFRNQRALKPVLTLLQNDFAKYNEILEHTRNLSQSDFEVRFLKFMGTDSQIATQAVQELNNALVVGLGGGITKSLANLSRLTGGVENLGIIVEKTFSVLTGHAVEELHNAFINRGLAAIKEVESGLAKTLIQQQEVAAEAINIAKSFGITEDAAKRLGVELNQAFSLEKSRAFQKQNEAIFADLRADLPGGGELKGTFTAALSDLEKLNRLGSVTDEQLRAVLSQFQAIEAQTADNGFFGQNLIQNQEFDVALAKIKEAFENLLDRRAELAKVPEGDFGNAETTAENLRKATEKFKGDTKGAAEELLKTIQPSDQLRAAMQTSAQQSQQLAKGTAQAAANLERAAAAQAKPALSEQIGRSIRAGDGMLRITQAGEKGFIQQTGESPEVLAANKVKEAKAQTAISAEKVKQSLVQTVEPMRQFKEATTQTVEPMSQLAGAVAGVQAPAQQSQFAIDLIAQGARHAAEGFVAMSTNAGQLAPSIQTASSGLQSLTSLALAAVQAFESMAAAAAKAAAAAAQAGSAGAQGRANGGIMRFLSGGGFGARGSDTIPAMLSPGEFVVNAKSSRQFFSQLQAINAGQTPVFRENGGSVDNSLTIGDLNIHGARSPDATGRAVIDSIKRELRRGSRTL